MQMAFGATEVLWLGTKLSLACKFGRLLHELTTKLTRISVPVKLLLNIIRNFKTIRQRGLPIRTFLVILAVRTFLTTFTPREVQFMLPSTSAAFQAWVKSQVPRPRNIFKAASLKTGSLHWLEGQPSHIDPGSKVLFFLHGGGYAVPLGPAHLKWCKRHFEVAAAARVRLHVAILEYTLCPEVHYPRQLQQAGLALQDILNLGFKPGDIVVGGDSAGGNLTLALLCHLLHPHPDVLKVQLNAPLAGAFCISPWLTMEMSTPSYMENKDIDMLSPSLVQQSGIDFLPNECASQPWALALNCPIEWWSELHICVSNLYLNAGNHEMFRDHVMRFARILRQSTSNAVAIHTDIGEHEAHDHVLTEFMMGSEGGRAFNSLAAWMLETFKKNAEKVISEVDVNSHRKPARL